MHRLALSVLLAAWLAACGSSSDSLERRPTIDDGLRTFYSLGEGSPDAAAKVIRRRLARARIKGWASVEGDRIVVDLAGMDDEKMEAARDLIRPTAKLQLQLVENDTPIMDRLIGTVPNASADGIEVAGDQWRGPSGDEYQDRYLRATDGEEVVDIATAKRIGCYNQNLMVSGGQVRCMVTGRTRLEHFIEAAIRIDPTLALPDDHQIAFERITQPDRRPYWRTYYLDRTPKLTNDGIADARPYVDHVSERRAVQVTLTDGGRAAFAEVSRAQVGKKLAIVIDGRVVSAPIINGPITGGRVTITMDDGASPDDLRNFAIALASGALPGPIVEESVVLLKDGKVVLPPEY